MKMQIKRRIVRVGGKAYEEATITYCGVTHVVVRLWGER